MTLCSSIIVLYGICRSDMHSALWKDHPESTSKKIETHIDRSFGTRFAILRNKVTGNL